MPLYHYLSICLSIYLSVYPFRSICLSIYLNRYICLYLSCLYLCLERSLSYLALYVSLSLYIAYLFLSVRLKRSICQCLSLSTKLYGYIDTHLMHHSIYRSISLSIYLYVSCLLIYLAPSFCPPAQICYPIFCVASSMYGHEVQILSQVKYRYCL